LIVVVADGADDEALALVSRWRAAGAVRLTPGDLSNAGWSALFPEAGPTFVAEGESRSTNDLTGAVVRLAAVAPHHLPHFAAQDREYAAAEMTAFLAYWLTVLPCAVVNRPSPSLLLGPAWTNEQWLTFAGGLGLPVATVTVSRDAAPVVAPPLEWVTIVGEQCFRASAPGAASAVELARGAGVALLAAGFDVTCSPPQLGAVTLRPPIGAEIADALLPMMGRP